MNDKFRKVALGARLMSQRKKFLVEIQNKALRGMLRATQQSQMQDPRDSMTEDIGPQDGQVGGCTVDIMYASKFG